MELVRACTGHSPEQQPGRALAVKGFLETSFVDWPGKVASVVFLPGCNFRCPFCHNHGLVLDGADYADIPVRDVLDRLREFEGWVDGVCITGGEPTLHPFLPWLMRQIRAMGMQVKLDTNGSRPGMLKSLLREGLVDYVAMDVKAPLEEFNYSRAAGVAVSLERIRETIEELQHGDVEYEFRTTVVPALHREEDLLHLAHQLRGSSSLTLQNFNPEDPLDQRLRGASAYPDEWISALQVKVDGILKGHP